MRTPPLQSEMTCGFLIQLVFCKKKTMWFIGVEVEQETSAPRPKKNPGSAPVLGGVTRRMSLLPSCKPGAHNGLLCKLILNLMLINLFIIFFILLVIYSMRQNTKINKCTQGLSFDRSHVVDPHLHKMADYFAF